MAGGQIITGAVYDDNKIRTKFSESVLFGYGKVLDIALSGHGVQEVIECLFNSKVGKWECTCLLKDWRVFHYTLNVQEFSMLDEEDGIEKILKECIFFEDLDSFEHWYEIFGLKNNLVLNEDKKGSVEKTTYEKKYEDALGNFFNGDVESLQKMMSSSVEDVVNKVII
jgi:hypothetical protein